MWIGDKVATLKDALTKAGCKPEDITKIFVKHKHPDHTGELHMFPNAKIYIAAKEADAMKLTGRSIAPHITTKGMITWTKII